MGLSDAIEKYDPRKNKWTVVGPVIIEDDIKNTPILLSNMGCSQINITQILIFGGIDIDGKTQKQCFIFEINEEYEEADQENLRVKGYGIHELVGNGSFQNGQAIVFGKKLFALQDSILDNKVDDSERNLIVFDSKVNLNLPDFNYYLETKKDEG